MAGWCGRLSGQELTYVNAYPRDACPTAPCSWAWAKFDQIQDCQDAGAAATVTSSGATGATAPAPVPELAGDNLSNTPEIPAAAVVASSPAGTEAGGSGATGAGGVGAQLVGSLPRPSSWWWFAVFYLLWLTR